MDLQSATFGVDGSSELLLDREEHRAIRVAGSPAHAHHVSGLHETGEGVHVPVGVVVRELAFEGDHLLDSERLQEALGEVIRGRTVG